MEKLKENKKLILIIVAVLVVAVVAAVLVNVFGGSYKSTIKAFEKASTSEKKMEKFVDKNVNLRAFYAMDEAEKPEDFEKEYKKAKKKDYTSDDVKDGAYEFYKMFVSEDEPMKVKEIGKLEKTDKLEMLGAEVEMKGLKRAEITLEMEGKDVDAYAYFYDGKLFILMPKM